MFFFLAAGRFYLKKVQEERDGTLREKKERGGPQYSPKGGKLERRQKEEKVTFL